MRMTKSSTLLIDLSNEEQYVTTYPAGDEERVLKVSQVEVTVSGTKIEVVQRGTHIHGMTGGMVMARLDELPKRVLASIIARFLA